MEVAIVFGREHSGLTNSELDHCHAVVRIPTDPEFRSLNIAAAVQILAYETQLVCSSEIARPVRLDADVTEVTVDDMERLYDHFEEALIEIDFLDPGKPKHLMRRLRRIFNRARIDRSELNILRGLLVAAQKAARR
jgi:tRNA (cytidine32/uridine32-2'-O)-methyltransferase